MGDFALQGLDRNSYGPLHEVDLLAIKPRPAPDVFSRWFTDTVIPKWHSAMGWKFKVIYVPL